MLLSHHEIFISDTILFICRILMWFAFYHFYFSADILFIHNFPFPLDLKGDIFPLRF